MIINYKKVFYRLQNKLVEGYITDREEKMLLKLSEWIYKIN